MQKKIKIVLVMMLAIFMCVAITNSKAEAQTAIVSPSKTAYTINGGKYMYKYIESTGKFNNIYCLDYEGVLNDRSVYTVAADIYNLSDSQINDVFGSKQNYNKALWIMDNMFISQNQTKDETNAMISQLKQILHSEVSMNEIKNTCNVPNLTASDIDSLVNHVYLNKWYDVFFAVQQSTLWNYTVNTKPFPGLKSLYGGYDLQSKYYLWMYVGLNAVANTKGDYISPNKNATIQTTINSLTMDSKSATIDIENRRIGPFIINGYNNDINTMKEYSIKINGIELSTTDYWTNFDGKNLYITIKNSNYDLSAAKVDVSMNVVGVRTSGTYLYKTSSQDIISL